MTFIKHNNIVFFCCSPVVASMVSAPRLRRSRAMATGSHLVPFHPRVPARARSIHSSAARLQTLLFYMRHISLVSLDIICAQNAVR